MPLAIARTHGQSRAVKMGLAHGAGPTLPVIGVGLGYDLSSPFKIRAYKSCPYKPLALEA
ncbi:hypothetical protein H5410_025743 [Solanum commersonii]|uniref:Uncharacterized protein n=1 Tax=Solanum commersonii TaxID=4109 RepID=A0A9J5YU07_SOLCO|nr:hypothetical protein H5410_025743 [Solanum commersonii]